MKDFPIRLDLRAIGLPERTIRVLEKAAQIVEIVETASGQQAAINAITEEQEDQNLSLTSLDGRLDALETNAPYVSQDDTPAWADPSGTLARTTFAAYAGQTVSNPPTQAEVQAIDDHLKALSQRLAALITDLRGNGSLT